MPMAVENGNLPRSEPIHPRPTPMAAVIIQQSACYGIANPLVCSKIFRRDINHQRDRPPPKLLPTAPGTLPTLHSADAVLCEGRNETKRAL